MTTPTAYCSTCRRHFPVDAGRLVPHFPQGSRRMCSGTGREIAPPPESEQPVDLVTVAEVAAITRVSKMTVYRLVHAGELPAVRVGRSFRVRRGDVTQFLKDAEVGR